VALGLVIANDFKYFLEEGDKYPNLLKFMQDGAAVSEDDPILCGDKVKVVKNEGKGFVCACVVCQRSLFFEGYQVNEQDLEKYHLEKFFAEYSRDPDNWPVDYKSCQEDFDGELSTSVCSDCCREIIRKS